MALFLGSTLTLTFVSRQAQRGAALHRFGETGSERRTGDGSQLLYRRARLSRRSARLAARKPFRESAPQGRELSVAVQRGAARLASQARRQRLGRSGVAGGMGRHRLERRAAI